MADDVVIRAEGLGKKYVIGHQAERERYVALRDVMARGAKGALARLAGRNGHKPARGTVEEFWALKDVSFEVKRGEVLGIIGRNGAGKSTLLKILSRITEPSEGRVTIHGRVASLLEVGTGFHPELTGRENIYLNGAILGMTRAEIRRKFDEIVAFAEVEKFLDTPVKRYSSGMYVRLAFAVAAHLEPEILVVDEVLAVGDAEFQKKCLGKMQDVAAGGRSVLFVSHNMAALRGLCTAALLLVHGNIESTGPAELVVQKYLNGNSYPTECKGRTIWTEISAPGTGDFRLIEVSVRGCSTNSFGCASPRETVELSCVYRQGIPIHSARLVFQLVTAAGDIAFSSTDYEERTNMNGRCSGVGLYRSTCRIPPDLLNNGTYLVRIRGGIFGAGVVVPETDACFLTISGESHHGSNHDVNWPGAVCPRLSWRVEAINEASYAPAPLSPCFN